MSALDSWVTERPRLLRTEQELAHRFTGGRVARDGRTIVFEEVIHVRGVAYRYQMRFAPDHPFTAPRVYLLSPRLPATLEIHRFSDGSLCLHGTDEWHPGCTAALWLRNRVVAWIAALDMFSRTGRWDMHAGRHHSHLAR